jgi:hypothetical protein
MYFGPAVENSKSAAHPPKMELTRSDNAVQIDCKSSEAIQCRCAKAEESQCSSRQEWGRRVGVSLFYKLAREVRKSARPESDCEKEWTMQHMAADARCTD